MKLQVCFWKFPPLFEFLVLFLSHKHFYIQWVNNRLALLVFISELGMVVMLTDVDGFLFNLLTDGHVDALQQEVDWMSTKL